MEKLVMSSKNIKYSIFGLSNEKLYRKLCNRDLNSLNKDIYENVNTDYQIQITEIDSKTFKKNIKNLSLKSNGDEVNEKLKNSKYKTTIKEKIYEITIEDMLFEEKKIDYIYYNEYQELIGYLDVKTTKEYQIIKTLNNKYINNNDLKKENKELYKNSRRIYINLNEKLGKHQKLESTMGLTNS